jgi:hypothetical protein
MGRRQGKCVGGSAYRRNGVWGIRLLFTFVEATGAELPVFAVFNLEGKQQWTCEITTEPFSVAADPTSLPAKIPFRKSQAFARKIDER